MKTPKEIRRYFRNELRFRWARAWILRSGFMRREEISSTLDTLRDQQDRMFFMLGNGRSGTQLISNLLNNSKECCVFHEPNFWDDVGTMDIFRRHPEQAIEYWKRYRCQAVYKRWREFGAPIIYGEVNGTIRYHAPAIQTLFPRAVLLHLVRDGRNYVRSVMGMSEFYNKGSKGAFALEPLPGDPYVTRWSKMSRFEKICWSWREANQFLSQYIPESRIVKLEQLATNYAFTRDLFHREIGITISRATWDETTSKRSNNSTRKYDFPPWQEWSDMHTEQFNSICGDIMNKLGY